MRISKDERSRSVVELASPSHSLLSLIYTPSKHHVASACESVLPKLYEFLSADVNHSASQLESAKVANSCQYTTSRFSVPFSL